MKNYLLSFIALMICSSCVTNSPITPSEQINLDEIAKQACDFKVEIKQMFGLETIDESLISRINKIICRAPYIYILSSKQKTIFIFNYDGKYVDKIHRTGRAKGEYTSIEDFDIDDNGDLYILSAHSKKIIKFIYPTYSKFEEIRIRDSMTEICVDGNRIYTGGMYTSDGLVGLGIMNLKEGTTNNLIEIRKDFDRSSDDRFEGKPKSFYKSADCILFNQRFSRQIYELNQVGQWQATYEFNSKLPVKADKDNKDFRGFRSIHRINDILLGQLWQHNFHYPLIYIRDIKHNKESLCNTWNIGLPFLTDISIKDDNFIMAISPINLQNIQNNKIIKDILAETSEDANPLILEFSITTNL